MSVMTELGKKEQDYFHQMRELLGALPDELQRFEELWAYGKYRDAYVFVTESVERHGLTRSPANRVADENFFWGHMY
jgi:hypothetical protein